jgi:MSHA biogenesis protein MshG
MPEFQYQGRDNLGAAVKGVRKANSASELAERLQQENIIPVKIELYKQPKELFKKVGTFFHSVPSDELQMFCRQMYTLNKSGVPLTMGLSRLAETTKNHYFSKILNDFIVKLNEGKKLSQAMSEYPNVFSTLFYNIVAIGENTGRLDTAFLQLSEYLQLEENTRKRIKAATRYPIIVVSAALIALLIINAFVVPAFAQMFANFKGELPLPTKILIVTSNAITGYWYIILIVFALLIGGFLYYINLPSGKLAWHRFILKIPLVGWIINRILLARFARLFALILKSGISIYEGMQMVSISMGNAYLEKKLMALSDLIARGQSIAQSAAQSGLFSSLVIQILTTGEETGRMDQMLDDVAEYYEREVEYDLDRLSDALEPILLVIMAIMVLILALGVFLPMWDMVNLVRK